MSKPELEFWQRNLIRLLAVVAILMLSTCQIARAQRIFTNGFEGGSGGAPPIDHNACTLNGQFLAGIQPAGFLAVSKTWRQAFSAPACSNPRDPRCKWAVYPNGLGTPVPLGANRGQYLTIAFTPTPNLTVDMSWDNVQANHGIGYPNPRPADSMFFAISRCPGDLRPPSTQANPSDSPWLRGGCRRIGSGGSLFYKVGAGESSANYCRLEPGVVHYLTVAPVNPMDGLTIGELTCSTTAPNSANGCDVGVMHQGTQQ